MTHKELVNGAKEWLLSAKQCSPVFTERGSARISEMPDAIGWSGKGSIVVEVKVSRSDFMVDAKKPFRMKPELGMGKFRFMMMPQDLYTSLEGHDFGGWGVLTVKDVLGGISRPTQVRLMGSKEFDFSMNAEINFLRSRLLEVQRFGR